VIDLSSTMMAKNLALATFVVLALSLASAEDSCAVAGNCPDSLEFKADGALGLLQKSAKRHAMKRASNKNADDHFAKNAINAVFAKFAEKAKQAAMAEGADLAADADKAVNAAFSAYAGEAYFADEAGQAQHTCSKAATEKEDSNCEQLRAMAVIAHMEDAGEKGTEKAAALAQKFVHHLHKSKSQRLAVFSTKSQAKWEYDSPSCVCKAMSGATLVNDAQNATCAEDAENALFAQDAKFADDAVYASNAENATYAGEAEKAVFAKHAGKAAYAFEVNAATVLMQTKAGPYRRIQHGGKADCDVDIDFNNTNAVDFAKNAMEAEEAEFAWNASEAANAEGAGKADAALKADEAIFAKFAENAEFASKAENAKHTCSRSAATVGEPAKCADLRKLAEKDGGEDNPDGDDNAGASLAQKLSHGLEKSQAGRLARRSSSKSFDPDVTAEGSCKGKADSTEHKDAAEAKCAQNAVNAAFAGTAKFAAEAVFASDAYEATFALEAIAATYAEHAKDAEYAF